MPIFGPTVVVVDQGRVLLQLREDTATWCLPGGAIEAGESLAEAAVRKVREETGLEVVLECLVGVYSKPRWRRGGGHDLVFRARPVRGDLSRADPAETLGTRCRSASGGPTGGCSRTRWRARPGPLRVWI